MEFLPYGILSFLLLVSPFVYVVLLIRWLIGSALPRGKRIRF